MGDFFESGAWENDVSPIIILVVQPSWHSSVCCLKSHVLVARRLIRIAWQYVVTGASKHSIHFGNGILTQQFLFFSDFLRLKVWLFLGRSWR